MIYSHNIKQKPVNNEVLQQFDKQRNRGTQGFGLYDGQHIVRATTEDQILPWLCLRDTSMLLFHHRFPTSTTNEKKAAHPFTTRDYFGDTEYILIHNGIIRNPTDRMLAHKQLGITYHSQLDDGKFNDSEALLWQFALTMENKATMDDIYGDMAFICVKTVKGKPTRLYFARKGRPLHMFRDSESLSLSSEGIGEDIPEQRLYTYNYELDRLTHRYFELHYWKKVEIVDQPEPSYTDSNYVDDDDFEERWARDWEERYPETNQAGDWLPSKLRDKFQKWLKPVNTQVELTPDEIEENYESYLPLMADIMDCMDGYLINARGNFEQAYWAVELDYSELEDLPDTEANIKERILLERVLEQIQYDPEYVNEKSISSVWKEFHGQTK